MNPMHHMPHIDDTPTQIGMRLPMDEPLDVLLTRYPHHTDLHHLKAIEQVKSGALDDALISYHKATNLNDKYHPIIHFQGSHLFLDKAVTLLHLKREDEAEKDFEHAVFLDHRNTLAINRTRTSPSNALSDYHPSTSRLTDYHNRIKLSMHGYLFDAIPMTNGDDLPFDKATLAHDAAYTLQETGNITQARDGYKAVLKDNMRCRHSWHHLGQCHVMQGELYEAVRCFGRSAAIEEDIHQHYHTDAARHYCNRGIIYLMKEDWDMALNDFNKALNLNKDDAKATLCQTYATEMKQASSTRQILPISSAV